MTPGSRHPLQPCYISAPVYLSARSGALLRNTGGPGAPLPLHPTSTPDPRHLSWAGFYRFPGPSLCPGPNRQVLPHTVPRRERIIADDMGLSLRAALAYRTGPMRTLRAP